MAEFLLMPFGSAGDTYPFIGLGRCLKEKGHNVTLVANGHFATAVRNAGLRFKELGSAEEYREAIANPDIWHPTKGFFAVVGHPMMPQVVQDQHQLIVELYNKNPQLVVVAGSMAFGARVAQETHGVRTATVHLSPSVFLSVQQPPRMPNMKIPGWWPRSWVRGIYWLGNQLIINPTMHRVVGAYRKEIGLPKERRYFRHWIHSPALVLGMFPSWFAKPAPDWPSQTQLTHFPLYDDAADQPLAPEVVEYLNSDKRPIVFTFGSAMQVGQRLFASAVAACEKLGRRGMLLTPFKEQLPANLPGLVKQFDYVPLAQLLPHAKVLVHHGGIGTTAQALRAGVPQLITPLAHDQFDNAERVQRLGAGRSLPGAKVTGPRIAKMLDDLLESPQTQSAAQRVAQAFVGKNGIEQTCQYLEELAARRTTTRPAK